MNAYDRMSPWYDLLTGPFERRYREAGLRLLAPQAGESCLELGFGTGHGLVALGRATGHSGRAVGVDTSQGMCNVARTRVAQAGLAGRVAILRADALPLPLDPAAFDLLFMSFTLELFPAPQIPRVLAACRRVLRPGGRLGVVAMAQPQRPGAMSRLYGWMHRRFPAYVDCRPIDVRGYLEQAGFRIGAEETFSMGGLPVAAVVAQSPAQYEFLVRQAIDADVLAILRLQEQWAEEGITYGFVADGPGAIRAALGELFLVAETAGGLAGFVQGSTHIGRGDAVIPAGEVYLEIDNLYVAPGYRRHGLGGQLVDRLLARAREEGIRHALLGSATKDVHSVLRFYEAHGFRTWFVQMVQHL